MALGASPGRVIAMVVWQGVRLASTGIGHRAGRCLVCGAGRRELALRRPGLDPLTFIAAPIVLAGTALLACYIPARRAARISPLAALGR